MSDQGWERTPRWFRLFPRGLQQTGEAGINGTATVELAVLLPFLFTLGFGMFEFGHLVFQYHLISAGVRDAARYLAGNPQGVNDPDAAAKNIAMCGTANTCGASRVPWWNNADSIRIDRFTFANNDGDYRGGAQIMTVRVSTSVSYGALGFLEFLNLGPITLTASYEERMYQNR
jgi:Flp pilus assembly protein TadG